MRNRTLFSLLLAALLAPAAFAGKKEDLLKQAQAAVSSRNLEEAARAYCELARMDSKYQGDCNINTQEAERERKRNEDRFAEGLKFFHSGAWDDAEQKLKNIKTGPRLAEAQRMLAQIPGKRREAEENANDAALNARFDQAVQAYNRNDFNAARSQFSQLTSGKRAGDANNYLNKIKQYESAIAEGDRLSAAGNHRQALSSYNDAATLKSDGPGDPRGKASQMQARLSAPAQAPAQSAPTQTVARIANTPTPPPRQIVAAAVKQPERPKLDVGKLMREAAAARGKGDSAAAKGKYLAVLAEDSNNAAARSALMALHQEEDNKPQQAAAPKIQASSEADVMLVRAISEYYQGAYSEAETHIKDYLGVNGSKTALSQFYLGASKLTRYYLGGSDDKKLYNDAQAAFRMAKKTDGFQPPGETFVSPKILKVYQSLN